MFAALRSRFRAVRFLGEVTRLGWKSIERMRGVEVPDGVGECPCP